MAVLYTTCAVPNKGGEQWATLVGSEDIKVTMIVATRERTAD